jgi:hypothetical protein
VGLGYSALLDGLVLQRIEDGDRWRRADAERRAFAMLELLLGSASASSRPQVARPRPEPYSVIGSPRAETNLAS